MARVKKTGDAPAKIAYNGTISYRNGASDVPIPAKLAEKFARGFELKKTIEAAEAELKRVNAEIFREVGDGVTATIPGVCTASSYERTAVNIADSVKLKNVLGDRYDDLVKVRETLGVTDKLREMVLAGADTLAKRARECVEIAKSPVVTFRPAV